MSTDPVTNRTDAARRIAVLAGDLANAYFQKFDTLTIDRKGHQDLVSEGDKQVELLVRQEIAKAFPDDSIVGEEHAPVAGTSGYTWVIDPIDGTANFVRGIPAWTVVVAINHDARTVAGVIYDPVHNEIFHAQRGGGAFCNDVSIRVAKDADIKDGSIGIGFSGRTTDAGIKSVVTDILERGGVFYRNASGALMLTYVACGKLLGYLEEHMNAWDCLAGQLLVQEAGGCIEVQDADQALVDGVRVVVAAPGIWAEVQEIATKAYG